MPSLIPHLIDYTGHRPLIVTVESRRGFGGDGSGGTDSGSLFGCSSILSISRLASSHASRFYKRMISESTSTAPKSLGVPYLLCPFTMRPGHVDAHFSDVRHFLSLESVKVGLNRRTRILEILGSEMNCVFQLKVASRVSNPSLR